MRIPDVLIAPNVLWQWATWILELLEKQSVPKA